MNFFSWFEWLLLASHILKNHLLHFICRFIVFLYVFCNLLSPSNDCLILIILQCSIGLCLNNRSSSLRDLNRSIESWCYLRPWYRLLILIIIQYTYDVVSSLKILSNCFFWFLNALYWIFLSCLNFNRWSGLIEFISTLNKLSLLQRLQSFNWKPLFRSNRSYLHYTCRKLLLLL